MSGKWRSLHSLWDASANLLGGSYIDGLTADLIEEYPRDALTGDLEETDPEKWAIGSYDPAATESTAVSSRTRTIPRGPRVDTFAKPHNGQRRAALAAFRLADILKPTFELGECQRLATTGPKRFTTPLGRSQRDVATKKSRGTAPVWC